MTEAVELHARDRALKELVFHGSGGEERVATCAARMVPLVRRSSPRAQASGQLRAGRRADRPGHVPVHGREPRRLRRAGRLEPWRRALELVLDGLRAEARRRGRALTEQEFGRAVALSARGG